MLFTILRCRCSGGKVVSTKVSCTTPTRCGIATDTKESLNIDALLDKYSLKGGKLEDTAGDKSLRYTHTCGGGGGNVWLWAGSRNNGL